MTTFRLRTMLTIGGAIRQIDIFSLLHNCSFLLCRPSGMPVHGENLPINTENY